MSDTIRRTGSCLCGGVQFSVRGPPLRIGLCHCKDCRKTGGSTYSADGSPARVVVSPVADELGVAAVAAST